MPRKVTAKPKASVKAPARSKKLAKPVARPKTRTKTVARGKSTAKSQAKHKIIRRVSTVKVKGWFRPAVVLPVVLLVAVVGTYMTFRGHATAGPAPVSLRAYTGGNTIALLWNPAAGDTPTQYKVYRGSVVVGTINPSAENVNTTTQRYYDPNVIAGAAYGYQVSAVNAAGEESAKSALLNVTHPTTPVAVPTVNIDPSVPASLQTFASQAKTVLQQWYPKIQTLGGNPTGACAAITLKSVAANPGYDVRAQASSCSITMYQNWAVANAPYAMNLGLFVREATNLVNAKFAASSFSPLWVSEGMAEYVQDYVYANNVADTTALAGNYYWRFGGDQAAFLFNWIKSTYSRPNFYKDLTTAMLPATYPSTFFQGQTGGLSVGDLWFKATGTEMSSKMELRNAAASLCMDTPSSSQAPLVKQQLWSCNNGRGQSWFFKPLNNTTNQGEVRYQALEGYFCLGTENGGLTDGVRVQNQNCDPSNNLQKWSLGARGQLVHVASGKCVQPIGGAVTQATGLEIRTCVSGSNIQNWQIRPLGQMKSNYGYSCVDIWGSGTTAGTKVDIYTCNATQAQKWVFKPTSTGSTNGAITALGQCLDVKSSGTADGTLVQMWTCNGTGAQKWIFQSDGTVKNVNSGKCLNIPSWTNGTQLTIKTCDGTNNLMRWSKPSI